ncbi:TetR/AcrR family transcriptional regulator [Brevundimonas sp. NIBR10]|uniref:TetR/AcrR family transcriptional regulator n=1 Tax=Brevundimonas sp. NIBR10 TaxID=3015997 RepID=UPI0022F1BA67|nr:TetR/AcrR family transcriptional regulator [Brevundimonas sp. NIBR10]
MEATVDCLHQVGYAATTTPMVSRLSGVTRGGLLHHYPSKVALIIATGEYCLSTMHDDPVYGGEPTPSPEEVMAKQMTRYGIALTEIIVGSRSDHALAAEFSDLGRAILTLYRRGAEKFARDLGISDSRTIEAMIWLHMAAFRGMALMQMAGVRSEVNEEAIALLHLHRETVFEKIRAAERGPGREPQDP